MSVLESEIAGQAPEATAAATLLKIAYDRASFRDLDAEIESSKERILCLADNWDGEGSPRYSRATLDRATAFVRAHASWVSDTFGKDAPVPHINPGPEGSIDIHWKQPTWELLINVPADANQKAAFYGDDYGSGTIKGSWEGDRYNSLLRTWLMR